MSEEKNLEDKFDDAKESIKETADKAKESMKDAADKVKEETKEFSDDVKETVKDFNDSASEVLSDGKNVAIIAHITLIGLIIAFIMNGGEKRTEFASFYLRQLIGITLLGFVLTIIPVVNLIGWILPMAMWVVSIIGALGGKTKPVFLLGEKFQEWFKSI